jgi:hypothetical protein
MDRSEVPRPGAGDQKGENGKERLVIEEYMVGNGQLDIGRGLGRAINDRLRRAAAPRQD